MSTIMKATQKEVVAEMKADTATLCLWDIEGVRVPSGFDPRMVIPSLRLFLQSRGFQSESVTIQAVVGNLSGRRISMSSIHWLCSDGLHLISLNDASKQSVDKKLTRRMTSLVLRKKKKKKTKTNTLILLAGDGGFNKSLVYLAQNGFDTLVIHPIPNQFASVLQNFATLGAEPWASILNHGVNTLSPLPPAPFFGSWDLGIWNAPWVVGPLGGSFGMYPLRKPLRNPLQMNKAEGLQEEETEGLQEAEAEDGRGSSGGGDGGSSGGGDGGSSGGGDGGSSGGGGGGSSVGGGGGSLGQGGGWSSGKGGRGSSG